MTDAAGEDVLLWRPISDYVPGRMVLLRGADRQVFGVQERGAWFEVIDGEEYLLEDFKPTEWCEAPGGPLAWA